MQEITDAQLDAWAKGPSMGHARSVEYLRPLTPAQRALAMKEAKLIQNSTPGYRFSAAVWQAVENVKSGNMWGQAKADALMTYDPTGHKAASHRGDWSSFVTRAMCS